MQRVFRKNRASFCFRLAWVADRNEVIDDFLHIGKEKVFGSIVESCVRVAMAHGFMGEVDSRFEEVARDDGTGELSLGGRVGCLCLREPLSTVTDNPFFAILYLRKYRSNGIILCRPIGIQYEGVCRVELRIG